jgi:hypothetical protein
LLQSTKEEAGLTWTGGCSSQTKAEDHQWETQYGIKDWAANWRHLIKNEWME